KGGEGGRGLDNYLRSGSGPIEVKYELVLLDSRRFHTQMHGLGAFIEDLLTSIGPDPGGAASLL
ncbi:MAG TPA: hypothetical protein VFB12_26230, partial [Ktedonobacteraceae bacterium]|nr:hypothetical protein [Ktedonobacteraceae bacterium]